jgi:hypothetical protein
MTQKARDIIKLVIAALAASAPVLALFGVQVDWLEPEALAQIEVFLGALATLVIALAGVWMNTFTRRKAFEEAERKKQERIAEEREGL